MRTQFPEYYPRSSDDLKKLWQEGFVSLDANVLLGLFREKEATRTKLLELIENLRDRIWITHQAAAEYQENRPHAVAEHSSFYERLESQLRDTTHKARTKFARHPYVDLKELWSSLETNIGDTIRAWKQKHPPKEAIDQLHEKLADLLDGKVGAPFTAEERRTHEKESGSRIGKKTPPGYMDKAKGYPHGDYLMWRQLLDHATVTKTPCIFVTNDKKEDWFWIVKPKTIGPRPELVREMRDTAGQQCHIYTWSQFVECHGTLLGDVDGLPEAAEAIRETEAVLQRTQARHVLARRDFISDVAHEAARNFLAAEQQRPGVMSNREREAVRNFLAAEQQRRSFMSDVEREAARNFLAAEQQRPGVMSDREREAARNFLAAEQQKRSFISDVERELAKMRCGVEDKLRDNTDIRLETGDDNLDDEESDD